MSYHPSEEPLSKERLKEYFIEGFKKPDDLKIGVEWEKIGVYKDSGLAIPYSGSNGVAAILRELVRKYRWQPVFDEKNIIALKKDGSSVTLEPGGQIELSGLKTVRLDENAAELHAHLKEIKEVSDPLGITWLGIGLQPVSPLDTIEWVPKERYRIMREALKSKGTLTHCMMKQTAAIQVSVDFTSEADAVEKFRLAMGLAPVLTAMFANSPVSDGKLNGYYSKRAFIWRNTDPGRTGILEKAFDKNFSLEDYIEFALDVPMLFIMRQGRWIPMNGVLFREFAKKGVEYYFPTIEDWQLHLTTIFTEARLKKYLEIRSMDCQRPDLALSAVALLKGLFYDEDARKKAWELVADLSWGERAALEAGIPLKGLNTSLKGKPLWESAKNLLNLAEKGLSRLPQMGLAAKGEENYLSPLKELLLNKGIMPAQILIDCYKKGGSEKEVLARLLECALI